MTQEQLDKVVAAYEKILKELDNAIEQRDLAKAEEIVDNKLVKFNKKQKGMTNTAILESLNNRVKKITEEMKSENGLDTDEIKELADIRKKIMRGKEPFQKTEEIIKTLTAKGVTQEELKGRKEDQKRDNQFKINGITEINNKLSTGIADIEMRYIDPIKDNENSIKIIKDMHRAKSVLKSLDPAMDGDRINATKAQIRSFISDLSSKGIDVTGLDGFESDLSVIDTFMGTKIRELETKNIDIASKMAKDVSISGDLRSMFSLYSVKDVNSLKEKYSDMTNTRQKNVTKIRTLENENVQIDDTIVKMQKEEILKNIAYEADGNEKDENIIAGTVLSNPQMRAEVNGIVETMFSNPNNRTFFPKLRDRMDYYKENGDGGFKAFFKAVFNSTNKTKMLATRSEAAKFGKNASDIAIDKMESRKKAFMQSIKTEVQQKRAKDDTLSTEQLKNETIEKALEDASR